MILTVKVNFLIHIFYKENDMISSAIYHINGFFFFLEKLHIDSCYHEEGFKKIKYHEM